MDNNDLRLFLDVTVQVDNINVNLEMTNHSPVG